MNLMLPVRICNRKSVDVVVGCYFYIACRDKADSCKFVVLALTSILYNSVQPSSLRIISPTQTNGKSALSNRRFRVEARVLSKDDTKIHSFVLTNTVSGTAQALSLLYFKFTHKIGDVRIANAGNNIFNRQIAVP